MTLISSRTARGRCPVCGGEHAVCGPPSAAVPVDESMEVAVVGGSLKRYKVSTPSGVETVMKLNEDDAKRLGGEPVEENAQTLSLPDSEPEKPTTKRRTAANKSRTAADKDGGTGGGDD